VLLRWFNYLISGELPRDAFQSLPMVVGFLIGTASRFRWRWRGREQRAYGLLNPILQCSRPIPIRWPFSVRARQPASFFLIAWARFFPFDEHR